MVDRVRVAVVYCPASGPVPALAKAAAGAAEQAGAEVRLRAVSMSGEAGADEASLDDLGWADIILIGSPIQDGLFAAPIQRLMDGAGLLWCEGRFANKIVSSFTSSAMALSGALHRWGSIIISQGARAGDGDGGDPSGTESRSTGKTSYNGVVPLPRAELEAVEARARRAVEVARILRRGHTV